MFNAINSKLRKWSQFRLCKIRRQHGREQINSLESSFGKQTESGASVRRLMTEPAEGRTN